MRPGWSRLGALTMCSLLMGDEMAKRTDDDSPCHPYACPLQQLLNFGVRWSGSAFVSCVKRQPHSLSCSTTPRGAITASRSSSRLESSALKRSA
jgi:hypothetical protein